MKKFALVVGASGDIGSAICKRLANEGWSLYMHYFQNKKKIDRLLKELMDQYPNQEFIPVKADFFSEEGAENLSKQLFSVQGIVFSAGHTYNGLLEDTPTEEMEKLWRVHVQNPMKLIALLSEKLRKNKKSYIIFIGSIWGETGASNEVVYSAVKGAQHAFVKAYAKECTPNINVNAIAPGFIDTVMNQSFSEEERFEILQEIPLGKFGTSSDVANLVAFLMSGNANYMTGVIVKLNGGWYI